ncbi:hypothetical protein PAESOLCIP111_00206 [Paenibacillus solanacearum]|uniref:Uncharacterized protein n=1 Tax=Paenibacillus solanacearum TaxID=2048548 RepID=A0A916JS81_9BACL|nr:hypothetical protein [Paenibacillus solanacearum]CAG7598203.1 hypothetical protein PAESOLCIP111_00206 [Paenibacillus solanacearum]
MNKKLVYAWVLGLLLLFGMMNEAHAQQSKPIRGIAAAEHSGHMSSGTPSETAAPSVTAVQRAADSPGALAAYVASLLAVGLASLLMTLKVRRSGAILPAMSGMMAAMSIGMLASLLIGTIAGVMIGEMLIPTVIAVACGMLAGYFAGGPFGLLASMDGMLAGLMGGLMGAMLGVMAAGEHPLGMVLFLDLVFFIVLIPLYVLVNEGRRVGEAADLELANEPVKMELAVMESDSVR